MYLCREYTNERYPSIGQEFGGKDHSTVIHAVKNIKLKSKDDISLKNALNMSREGTAALMQLCIAL